MRNGDLFGRENTLGFVRIDPATLAWTHVPLAGPYPESSMYSGGMATSPAGEIYAWCSGLAAPGAGVFAKLFRIDPVAGTAVAVGGYEGLPTSEHVNAMAFTPDGRLFGFTEVNVGGPLQVNSVYEFDLQTALPTLVAQRGELSDVRGVVFLPEPGAMGTALLVGAGALARRGGRVRAKR
jgi:hypothetical protein